MNKGKANATPFKDLKKFYPGVTDREMYQHIERERLQGIPILSKRTDGGGYYMPDSTEEITEYLGTLSRTIQSHKDIYKAIEATNIK